MSECVRSGGSGGDVVTRNQFNQWMTGFKAVPEWVVAHAVVGPLAGSFGQTCGTASEPGLDYTSYANTTNGTQHSICEPDLGRVLEALFDPLGLGPFVPVDGLPGPDGIEVWIDGEPDFRHWRYEERPPGIRLDHRHVTSGSVVEVAWLPR